jgi:hypothetical protein
MLIGPADVRRLMEADDPDATLVIYQGRAAVIAVPDGGGASAAPARRSEDLS